MSGKRGATFGDGNQVVAAESADLALDATLLVGTLDARLAGEDRAHGRCVPRRGAQHPGGALPRDRRRLRGGPLPRVDIVVPGGDKEPAPAAATQMCERMLELGVVIQPTGVELNVRHERWASVEATAVVGIVERR